MNGFLIEELLELAQMAEMQSCPHCGLLAQRDLKLSM